MKKIKSLLLLLLISGCTHHNLTDEDMAQVSWDTDPEITYLMAASQIEISAKQCPNFSQDDKADAKKMAKDIRLKVNQAINEFYDGWFLELAIFDLERQVHNYMQKQYDKNQCEKDLEYLSYYENIRW